MGLYSRAKAAADHVITWVTFVGILAAVFAWLSSKVPPMKGIGWAGFILIGIALACAATLTLAAILSAWRHFKPLDTVTRNEDSFAHDNGDETEQKQFNEYVEVRFKGVDTGKEEIWKRINDNNQAYSTQLEELVFCPQHSSPGSRMEFSSEIVGRKSFCQRNTWMRMNESEH